MELTKREKVGLISFGIILILSLSIMYFTRNSKNDIVVTNGSKVNEIQKDGNLANQNSNISKNQNSKQEIKVYICGEIVKPGVYTLLDGDRVDMLVQLAGGITNKGDMTLINLAMKLKDEQCIVIPVKNSKNTVTSNAQGLATSNTSVGVMTTGQSSESIININTASKEQLKSLPRVGDALSQRIIDFREQNGPFKNIEQIKDVSGIGDKMFENIKDKITV